MAAGALVWDKTAERLYETGVSDVALFVQNASGAYQDGIAWNGITGVSESPEGADATDLYADNIKYLTMRSKESLKATITAYMYPEEFEICDGTASIIAGATIGQQSRRAFGLAYKTKVGNDVQGDDFGFKLHLLYHCTASPSSKDYKTINDSPEAIEFSWEVTTTEQTVGTINGVAYKPTASVVVDSTKFIDSETGTYTTKFKALLDYIYGTAETSPKMPTVAQVYQLLSSGSVTAG